jgi:hypothetical protein
MSDLMLHGVLNMPLPDDPAEMDVVTWLQFRMRARHASVEIASLKAENEQLRARLDAAASKVEMHLDDWANDLAATRDAYLDAAVSGKMNGRKIAPETARTFAKQFNERAEAIAEAAGHTSAAIRALTASDATTTTDDNGAAPSP